MPLKAAPAVVPCECRRVFSIRQQPFREQLLFLPLSLRLIPFLMESHADHLQTVVSAVEEAGDVMHLSQNVVETFIDRIEVFDDERVKIHFTFEDVLAGYAE